MHYVAWVMTQGGVPYRDVFDMNFPGVYLLHLLAIATAGTTDGGWRVFDLAWLAGTCALIALYVGPWGRRAAAGAALLFALYHLAGGAWQAGQRDFLLCAFLVAGALGVTAGIDRLGTGSTRLALAGGGLALGAALVIKPHVALLVVVLGGCVALGSWRAGTGVAAPLAAFVAGVAVVPAGILAWLMVAGALPAWRAIVVDYLLPLYSRLGRGQGWSVYRPHLWLALGAGAALSAAGAMAAGRVGARHVVATLGALYGVVHVVAQGKGWEYHLYPLAAFTIVLVFAEVEPALGGLRRPVAVPLLAGVLAAGILLTAKASAVSPAGWERTKAARVDRLTTELASRLRPGDTVQVLDTAEGGMHALLRLGVRQPTRFIYDFHFFHDVGHPTIEALRAELVRDLDARPPRLVVVFEAGWPAGGYERLETFPALARRLAEYDLVETGPGYRIHAQRHGS
jgi:hypothetical protein